MTDKTASPPAATAQKALYDELLVVLVQSGDRAAAERLSARWWPRLARAAHRLVGPERAEDAAQDAVISILKGLHGLRDPARFAPWAFGILRRRCVDLIRRSPYVAELQEQAEPEPNWHAPFERMAIAQAMDRLPPDQRFAAHLFFVEGLTLAEIADAQGVPLGTAKSRLFHARRQLKTALT